MLEKKFLISSISILFLLSTLLMFFMIKKDLINKEAAIKKMTEIKLAPANNWPKVEIETRK